MYCSIIILYFIIKVNTFFKKSIKNNKKIFFILKFDIYNNNLICHKSANNDENCRMKIKLLTDSNHGVRIGVGDLMSLIILDFFILILYFLIKLISLVDSSILYSGNGEKLNKYIYKNEQLKLTSNFSNTHDKFNFFSNIIYIIKSPIKFKHILKIIIIAITIVTIKIALTYKILFSNFVYITMFDKNINLTSILGDNYLIFIYLYYFLSVIFVLINLFKIFKIPIDEKSENLKNKEKRIFLGNNLLDNNLEYITYHGLYQNVLITGSIGSGKTSSAISNILDELLKNNTHGLIIDVKGNYVESVNNIAKKYDKLENVIVIDLNNDFKYNPLNKPELSSNELANYMIRVLKVLSKGNINSDPFWLDKSESYIRDFITIIRAYNNNFVNFLEIHKLVTDNSYINKKIEILKEMILSNKFCDSKLFEINSAIYNIKNEYLKLDERVIGIIKSEITRITNIFITDYNIYEKFCTENTKLDFFNNKIIVLSINIGKNRFLSKVLSTYLKLDFQQQTLSRINPKEPIFFICDEFQEIVNSEDSNFFSLSREYKVINVISVQSYNSLINALQDEKSANVIIQNLVNKIWFRNDDIYTVKEIIKQVGKIEKNIKTLSYTESGQNSKYSILNNKFKDYKTGLSKGYSLNLKDEYRFNEEYITSNLNTFEAICFISDGNKIKIIDKLKFKRWGEFDESK